MGEARIRAWLCGCWLQSRRSIPHGQACSIVPELPDLTVVAEELQRRATGRTVLEASAANPMLAGRFWLLDGADKVRARTGLRLRFTDGGELRYVDREMLGKLYLVA